MIFLSAQQHPASGPVPSTWLCHQLYFIKLLAGTSLSPVQLQQLGELLAARELQWDDQDSAVLGVVIPRTGLVSGWSEKATEILHLAGLEAIVRMEQGLIYSAPEVTTSAPDWDALIDPMLQQICGDPQAAYRRIFDGLDETRAADAGAATHCHCQWISPTVLTAELGAADAQQLLECQVRQPPQISDVELAMFQEVNSEHCRHHIFQAAWQWQHKDHQNYTAASLMAAIRRTTERSRRAVLSAYCDNSAVLRGHQVMSFQRTPGGSYAMSSGQADLILKVETHNHPTAVCPYPGAATGVGGEIRDEVATGRGGNSLAGVCGYMVSDLCLDGHLLPGERPHLEFHQRTQSHLASAERIMLEAPLGVADYGNEYGRPLVGGFFRTLLYQEPEDKASPGSRYRGFHKPLMICGGMGTIAREQVQKNSLGVGDLIVVLGGLGMKIGLGGGSQSSAASAGTTQGGSDDQAMGRDFASVQRENPQMQRRAYEVIAACLRRQPNPIISIHDVGAGGLANAVSELVHDSGLGASIALRDIPVADHTMNPREIWCNESQERYVLGITPADLEFLRACARQERAPMAVIGTTTATAHLRVYDCLTDTNVVDIHLPTLFARQPRTTVVSRLFEPAPAVDHGLSALAAKSPDGRGDDQGLSVALSDELNVGKDKHMAAWLGDALGQVLQLPCVADKSFLLTIADRSVGGRTVLEPMVGPWQVPVADAGVVLASYEGQHGQAIAMGEKPHVALSHPAVASRLAAAEAIMNALCADIRSLDDISFSANWQVDFARITDRAGLWAAVDSLSDFCCELGIAVPTGKDSMAMRAEVATDSPAATEQHNSHSGTGSHPAKAVVSAPITLVITAIAPVADVNQTLTPQLAARPAKLIWVNLSDGPPSLGWSALAMSQSRSGGVPPSDVRARSLKAFFKVLAEFKRGGHIYAYHDVSDGGLVVAALEMAFATGRGLTLAIDHSPYSLYQTLFGEGVGALMQVADTAVESLLAALEAGEVPGFIVAHLDDDHTSAEPPMFAVRWDGEAGYAEPLWQLKRQWSRLGYELRRRRDNPQCADEEWALNQHPLGELFFDPSPAPDGASLAQDWDAPQAAVQLESRPLVAILREQGVNGHMEMAYSFYAAGFEVRDLHMSELSEGTYDMSALSGLAAVGGFSYGDVLGAGRGWALVIQHNPRLREALQAFLQNPTTFALGVCNGCQMLAQLHPWIDGGEAWPQFRANTSGQFESRTVMVEVMPSPSIMWQEMVGMKLPVVVAHGEGRASYTDVSVRAEVHQRLVGIRYHPLKQSGAAAAEPAPSHLAAAPLSYPMNPNGSAWNVAGVTSADGRINLMMPHPERNTLSATMAWRDPSWSQATPWRLMFTGARRWVEHHHGRR